MMIKIVEHEFAHNKPMEFRRKTDEIILHCTATREGRDYTVETIDRWHKDRGFNCIGYHFVIYRDGTVHRGRPMGAVGAHCQGHNSRSISVCYVGGLDKSGKSKDTRTDEQKTALTETVKWLLSYYGLSISDVHGHREFAAKACPSFDANVFRETLLES